MELKNKLIQLRDESVGKPENHADDCNCSQCSFVSLILTAVGEAIESKKIKDPIYGDARDYNDILNDLIKELGIREEKV